MGLPYYLAPEISNRFITLQLELGQAEFPLHGELPGVRPRNPAVSDRSPLVFWAELMLSLLNK